MLIAQREKSSHWYSRSGQPVYEVEMKTKPGQFKRTTLREARALDLVPSVTTVLSVLDKPGLDTWKIEQAILAARTLPMLDGESEDDFVHRVIDDSLAYTDRARTIGVAHHDTIESYAKFMNGTESTYYRNDDVPEQTIEGFDAWTKKNGVVLNELEVCFASPYGYGGRIDAIGSMNGQRTYFDWKTKSTSNGIFWDTQWACQLAAYSHGKGHPDSLLCNVIVSVDEPGRIEFRLWETPAYWFDLFLKTYELWASKMFKDYDPRKII